MYLTDQIRRAGRSLRSAKARTLLTALAIAVGAFALTLTLAASNGATSFVNNIISENFDPAELIVVADENVISGGGNTKPTEYNGNFGTSLSNAGAITQIKRLTDEDLEKIKSLDGVENVREDFMVNLQYITRPDQKKYIATMQALSPYLKPELAAGDIPKPLTGKQVLLPEGFVNSLGFSSAQAAIGQNITVAVKKPSTTPSSPQTVAQSALQGINDTVLQEFTIVAVTKKASTSQPGTELYLYTSQDAARELNDITTAGTDNYRAYTNVFVKVAGGTNEAKLNAVQTEIEKLGYFSQSVKETQEFLTRIIDV